MKKLRDIVFVTIIFLTYWIWYNTAYGYEYDNAGAPIAGTINSDDYQRMHERNNIQHEQRMMQLELDGMRRQQAYENNRIRQQLEKQNNWEHY